jgi:hypothetical protein
MLAALGGRAEIAVPSRVLHGGHQPDGIHRVWTEVHERYPAVVGRQYVLSYQYVGADWG